MAFWTKEEAFYEVRQRRSREGLGGDWKWEERSMKGLAGDGLGFYFGGTTCVLRW